MMDNKNCQNCIYFQGTSDCVCTCDYILITGRKRPCDPGEGCTVKVKRRRKRKMSTDKGGQ